METRRLVLALALSAIVLFGWQLLFPPPRPTPRPAAPAIEETAPDDLAPRAVDPGAAAGETDAPADRPAYEAVTVGVEERVEIANPLYHVVLSNRGGRVLSWRLKQYTTAEGEPLELIPAFAGEVPTFPLALDLDDADLAARINQAFHEVTSTTVSGGRRVEFRWSDGELQALKSMTFRSDGDETGYLVDVRLEVSDRGRRLPARLAWGPGFGAQEGDDGRSNYYYSGQVVWNRDGAVTRTRGHKAEEGRGIGAFLWAGLEDQYFAALMLPTSREATLAVRVDEVVRARAEPTDPEEIATVAVSVPRDGLRLFVGPKKFHMLRRLGSELEKAVWFATNGFLAAVSKFVFLSLVWIHEHTIRNYGMAIILTTLILRILLFPLNQYSMVAIKKSQLQMQRLQPKVAAIKNRYKKKKDAESRAKMNQEMMAMYKKEGVNPMGGLTGCLPLLAQFPILIGFYNMLTVAVELRGAPFFGWIQDLSLRDPYWVTPLLMGATMFLQQKMAATKVTDPQQLQQQKIMMIMPFFFTFICIQMPAGLVLYWFANNVLGIAQQWLVNKKAVRLEAAMQKA